MNNTPALNDNINLTIEAVERNYSLIKEFENSTRIKTTNDKQVECDLTEGLFLLLGEGQN